MTNGARKLRAAQHLPLMYAYMGAARAAAGNALTRLQQASPAGQEPSVEVIGKTAYRAAELAASVAVLEQSETLLERVVAATATKLPPAEDLAPFDSPACLEAFKEQHFGAIAQDQDKMHFLPPRLNLIDQVVFEIAAHPEDEVPAG